MFNLDRQLRTALDNHRGVPFTFRDWNGVCHQAGDGPPRFEIHCKTRDALVRSFLERTLGFGEAYVRGDIVIDGDLEEVLITLADLYVGTAPRVGMLSRWLGKVLARTLPREKADIEHHYGLGDEFYKYYLDKKLQYSCGYFRTQEDSLDLAQEQKIAHTAAKLDLQPGQRLLDIGCGWGHLMFHAAETYGVECLGITLCDNQAAYIRRQAAERNLPVEVRVMNYLELDEKTKWDRVVSVGMMCHVGRSRADAYFDKVKALLAPGAVGLLHCIAKMKEDPRTDPFVSKYVFPGYWFFSLQGMTNRAVNRGLNILDVENLRRHYAMTAHHWRKNFLRNYDAIKATMGFDDRFMRTWEFYLASVVAGFRTGQMNLIQMVLCNGINDGYPWTREFLYNREPREARAEAEQYVG
jgi:cyclopropane-fatty-acyl-phospholipid synthase